VKPSLIPLPPFSIEVDGVRVTVLEVLKSQLISGETWYFVVVQLNYKGVLSRRYTLSVRDVRDLVNKLKMEVTKIKFIEYGYGLEAVRRMIA